MTRPAHLVAALAALLTLGGCGQKGSLFLPDRKKSTVPAASPATPPGATAPVPAPAAPPGPAPPV
jgi:predicted small lipoprotein YifL